MRGSSRALHRFLRALTVLGALAITVAGLVLLFSRAVDRDLNHDEHQFLAPAALFSREGLLPWRDYALFHLPNLVFAYGVLDWFSGNVLLAAKLLGFMASAGILISLVSTNIDTRRLGFLAALFVAVLLLSDPLFRYTAGKTWNHEVPTALLLAALGLFVAAARGDQILLTAAAGLAAGAATGCRLTFAPTLLGLALLTWFFPGRPLRRAVHLLVLTVSATVALAPSLYFAAKETEAFVFGNFEFPRLRLLDPTNERIQKTMTLWRKLRFFFKEVMVPSWPVFLLWGITAVRPAYRWFGNRAETDRTAAFALVLLPFVLLGCFAPSRYQYQHFFVVVPLLLLAASATMHYEHWRGWRRWALLCGGFLVAGVCGWRALPDYEAVQDVLERDRWYDARVRQQASALAKQTQKGPVLTLAPTFPLMGDLAIYPEFATGPFAWRSASLVPAEKRARLGLVAPEDLPQFLESRPPTAILTGVEDDKLEEPLIAWAREHGWRETPLKRKQTLWLPPATKE